jgi:hypothetical protein
VRWGLLLALVGTLSQGCGDDSVSDCGDVCDEPSGDDTSPTVDPVDDQACTELGECPDGTWNAPGTSQVDGGTVLALAVTNEHDHPLEHYQIHHPIRVHITLDASEEHHDEIMVGLVQKHAVGDDHVELSTCVLGSVEVDYYKRDEAYTFAQDFIIPDDCLGEGVEEMTYNLWIAQNPSKEDHPDQVELGGVAEGDYNTQFFNAEAIDTDGDDRNALCIGLSGDPGCVIDVSITPSAGDDLKLESFGYETSVFTVNADCSIDHGQPDFEVHSVLTMHGDASYDGETSDALPTNILKADAHLEYAMCPRAYGEDGGCVEGTDYKALAVSGHDDVAEGDDHSINGPIDALYADAPHVQIHDLHVDSASALCGDLNGDGDWSDYHLFNLRVCVVHDGDEAGPCDKDNAHCDDTLHESNNCEMVAVAMVREYADASGASSWSADYTWDKGGGNSVIGANAHFETQNLLNLSGATTHSLARLSITGWAPFDVFKIWLDAQAYVSLVGSGVDAGVEIFQQKLWGYTNSVPEELTYSDAIEYSKEACLHYNYGIAGIGLNVDLCASGSAGITLDAALTAKEGSSDAFASSTRIGDVDVTVEPQGAIGFSASASLNIGIARGGLTGNVDIITVNLPMNGNLQWGLVDSSDSTCNTSVCLKTVNTVSVDLVVTFLTGNVNVWVDLLRPNWCSCGSWCPGYPCGSWASVVNETIVSFSAYQLSQNLYGTSQSLTLQ